MTRNTQVKKLLLSACAFGALALVAPSAFAGGFANRQQSATGTGFAYAGAGTSAFGLGSMFWNPANITNFAGRNSEFNVSFINGNTSVQTTAMGAPAFGGAGANLLGPPLGLAPLGSGNINQGTLVPASYNSYQINNSIWIGLQSGSPFGSNTKPSAGFAGSVYGTSTKVKALAVTPTLGIKLNEMISVGFGVTIQHLSVDLKGGDPRFALFGPGAAPLSSPVQIEGDAYGVGWTAGVTIKPVQGTEISLGFRSSIHHSLGGTMAFANPLATLNPALASRKIKANANLPEIATLGLYHQINQQWAVTATAQWTNWSRVRTIPVVSTATGAVATNLGFRYKDEYFYSVGAEYTVNPNWKLRAGIAYEKSPIDDENRGLRVLDADRIWLSAGVGYKYSEKLSLDLSYSHIFLKNGLVNIVGVGNPLNPAGNPSHNGFINYSGRSKGSVDILALAVKYRWDDPTPSAAPIIKKF